MTWKQLLLVVVAASLAVLATGRAQTSSGATYEYRTIVLLDGVEGFGATELNKAAQDGWELVTVRGISGQGGVMYLKRRK